MGCTNCGGSDGGTPRGCKNNGTCSSGGCNKLEVFDWLSNMELPAGQKPFDCVEVRFKNTRKAFYRNTKDVHLHIGDVVVVEASPGHDVGVVTLTGELARIQFNKKQPNSNLHDLRKIYRKAQEADIQKWKYARTLEDDTMFRARKVATDLGLVMKISDVEYQGDQTKITFYYTAEERVDFRELIKLLADQFKVRIEMRQIGARQEAGRLGGIGSCGRELCCATWLTDFRSVSTSAARYQQLSLNPQKLAGQCGKLKCCLNYELDMYLEAYKNFPSSNVKLKTKAGTAEHQKTDIFKRTMWYSYIDDKGGTHVPIPVDRVEEIIKLNEKGKHPESLKDFMEVTVEEEKLDYSNVVGQDSLTRFDDKHKKKRRKKKGRRKFNGKGGGNKRSNGNKGRNNQSKKD